MMHEFMEEWFQDKRKYTLDQFIQLLNNKYPSDSKVEIVEDSFIVGSDNPFLKEILEKIDEFKEADKSR